MMKETVEDLIEGSLSGETRADWNYEYLSDKLEEIYDYSIPELYLDMEKGKIREETFQDLLDRYNNKERELGTEQFRGIERYIMLEVLDQRWRENLKNLTELREGIYLRSYGQKNPVNEYKIISTDLYNEMIEGIKREVSSFIMKIRVRTEAEMESLEHEPVGNLRFVHEEIEDENEVLQIADGENANLSRKERRELERHSGKGKR